MQFITNGPDIPDTLLQAHEDGRVVFFCGAGVSYPAGLPGFQGLVDNIYNLVGTTRNDIEEHTYLNEQFDLTLDLLERRLPGQRIALRTALAKALQPKLEGNEATDTHAALLQLARTRKGELRLVTTNFDRVFEHVAKLTNQLISTYAAPMLPIPKNSRWNGIVYLHGLLPDKEDDSALHRLVLTSGDFGLAYLTERWAARFVSELLRNYVVCFIGYSINDPVLRYMMDALAADRMQGEMTPQAYALGDYEPGQEYDKTIEWKAKGVVPILYEVPASRDHSALHNTLKAWAETYRDGTLGKERIVVDYALANPSASTQQDNFVGRMLWAISDKNGLPAKRFADFNPVPALTWLEAFSDTRYQQSDLALFGVVPCNKIDDKLRFSLILRPASYNSAPWMSLFCGGTTNSQWDDVMQHLARWLLRHMNDPELIIWLAQRGGQLHNRWHELIENKLDYFAHLEQDGKTDELAEISDNSPNAIPDPLMQTLWSLLLTGRVKSPWHNPDIYRWKTRLKRNGLSTTLRLELRELLSPKVILKKPFRWMEVNDSADAPKCLKQLVDWELVLAVDHVHSALYDLNDERWREALPALLDDFQQLLRDALDLICELGVADDYNDRSYLDLPSISSHWQNRGFSDWVSLIELLRDAWLAVLSSDPERARQIAMSWFDLSYPTFKRLSLFAASQGKCIEPSQWVDWLIVNDSRWLWSSETQRETMRLLVLQGSNLLPESRNKLETAILMGPPRSKYRNNIEPEQLQRKLEKSIWLYLAKLVAGNGKLGDIASQRFDELSEANPTWKILSHERDEFSHWMSGTGDPDYEEGRDIDIAPRKRRELVIWLKQAPLARSPFYEDTWSDTCRTRFFHSFCALYDLAQEGLWPRDRWSEALQAWSEEDKILRSWRFAAPLVQTMPDDDFKEIAHSITWWLKTASTSIDLHETIFFFLCRRIMDMNDQENMNNDDPVFQAINHPIGHITQALLNLWFKREPNDNEMLPKDIKLIFTQLCNVGELQFRHGRILLASNLISLFRVDRLWTESHLLPLFNWSINAIEAKSAWEGFLWSPRLYKPLLIAFKSQFLDTASHYLELGKHHRQFTAFLTYAALDPAEGYSEQDFQSAIRALSQEGLQEVAQTLSQAIEGTGEQREDYWKNRIQPFWQHVWPKSRDLSSNSIAESLARMSISARGEFPSALTAVMDWLKPIEYPHYILHALQESGLTKRFPAEVLIFLDKVIENQKHAPFELKQCLTDIIEVKPDLTTNYKYEKLIEYLNRHGI